MGAWRSMQEQFAPLLAPRRQLRYVGRPESASPATGSGRRHQQEQAAIVNDALSPGSIDETQRVRVVARRNFEKVYSKLWAYEGAAGVPFDDLLGPPTADSNVPKPVANVARP